MTSNADAVAQKLETIPNVQLLVATFVSRVADGTVKVDFGDGAVTILSAGVSEPLPGKSVRVIRIDDLAIMLGLSVPVSGIGVVTSAGSPLLTVTTSAGSLQLPRISSYSAVVGDAVLIDWDAGGVVIGKVSAVPAGTYVPPTVDPTDFSVEFRATDSGTYGGSWSQNDVWCSDSNLGAWFYGTAIADTIPDSATISRIQIYLPEFYNAYPSSLATLGVHSLAAKTGAPAVSGAFAVAGGAGWRDLPTNYADLLKTGAALGIGTNHGGYHKYSGRASDANSGLLRIDWTV